MTGRRRRPSHHPSFWDEPTASSGADPRERLLRPRDAVGDEPALASVRGELPKYRDHYRARRAETPDSRRWGAALLAILVAGPAGILGAFLAVTATWGSVAVSVFAVVLVGPAVEEFVKAGSGLYLAEQRPWLVPYAWTLVVIVVAGGLGFAVIENWIYLNFYIEDPSDAIVRWRWVFGPLVHGSASFLAGFGIARMWRRTHAEGVAPELNISYPWFVAAVVLHGGYNLMAVILDAAGAI